MQIDSMQDELDYPTKKKMITTKEAKKIMRESQYVLPPKPYIVAAYEAIPRKRRPGMKKLDKAQEQYDAMTDPYYETINLCPNCAEELIGDGVTVVMHCPFADEDDYFDHEPDADPVYCKEIEP